MIPLRRLTVALGAFVSLAIAHPMGNFSVNHYTRLSVGPRDTHVLFVLDLAELPSLELLQRWNLEATSSKVELDRKASAEARRWVHQLRFTANGKATVPTFEGAELVVSDGAGGLPVLRVSTRLTMAAAAGTLHYSDGTYPDRTAGWKEVVVRAGEGVTLESNSAGNVERSQGLTAYPQDPGVSPPQQLTADVEWSGGAAAAPVVTQNTRPAPMVTPTAAPAPGKVAVAMPVSPVAAATGSTMPEANAGGQVRRGDFLSKALRGKEIGWGLGLLCVAVAFWFGALHALEPGHGKTMVAAYLVGERGTPKHAVLLGGMVTFTHTVSVFVLGLLTMFLSRYIMPDVISKWLGVISGLTIVWIGGLLFYRRAVSLRKAAHRPGYHAHGGGRAHGHGRVAMTHTHGGSTHSHGVASEISMKSLMALGASGGLVPCPSALVLLLAAVSVGRIGFGLLLLVSFSLGLALVLMGTGLVVLYAKRFLPERGNRRAQPLARMVPVLSAAAITVIGMVLTGNALGWIPAVRFFG